MEPLHMTLFLFAAVLALIVPLRRLLAGRLGTRGRVWTAGFAAGVASFALTGYGTLGFETYGWVLFFVQPVLVGALVETLVGWRGAVTTGAGAGAAALALGSSGAILLLTGVEGVVCVVMALPLAVPLMFLGVWLARRVLGERAEQAQPTFLLAVLPGALLLSGVESRLAPPPPLHRVDTAIEVNAPPALVWRHVVSFPELPQEREWYFRTGIAYPIRAEIDGRGVGAVRRCVFSTGAFVEPIEVWDEPRLLRFGVTANPPAMKEWSPLGDIRPPHVEGFLLARRGQFRLVELPGGRTRLEGTTWYTHDLAPAAYWRLWSDAILHRVHLRVLRHIQGLAEADSGHSRR